MDSQKILQNVVSSLMRKGLSDEEISSILKDIGEVAFEQFTQEAMQLFSDEDLKAIDSCATQDEANEEIKKLYTLYTGKDATEQINYLLSENAKRYLEE